MKDSPSSSSPTEHSDENGSMTRKTLIANLLGRLHVYKRINIGEMAEKFRVSPEEIKDAIFEAVGEGKVDVEFLNGEFIEHKRSGGHGGPGMNVLHFLPSFEDPFMVWGDTKNLFGRSDFPPSPGKLKKYLRKLESLLIDLHFGKTDSPAIAHVRALINDSSLKLRKMKSLIQEIFLNEHSVVHDLTNPGPIRHAFLGMIEILKHPTKQALLPLKPKLPSDVDFTDRPRLRKLGVKAEKALKNLTEQEQTFVAFRLFK